ncbi:hypothetical protein A2U01_0017458 [Trifolium medium]|uniref:Uncharacterized protein n=1 Tax=Trifolium medium TaxID=97028 RepID=A0A392N9X0_9FABA|nr:hypothetical protein [Trifolium medium]
MSKKYESEPPVIVLPTFTFPEPPVSISPASSTFTEPPILPTFTLDHPDYNPYRIPLWSILLLIVGMVVAVIFCVVFSIFSQRRQRSPPHLPPVVLPPMPMIEMLPAQA